MKDITASAWIIPIAELKEEIQRSAHITLTATVYSYRRRPSDLLLLFYFCQFHTLWPLVNCWGFSVREKPLYLLRICWLPQVLVTYIVPNLGWGDILLLPLPVPILDLAHVQFACLFHADEQLFTQTAFYLVTWLPIKKTFHISRIF